MTHNFEIESARLPRSATRVHLCAPLPRGTAGSFAATPDHASGTNAKDMGRDNTRCRAFAAGGDP